MTDPVPATRRARVVPLGGAVEVARSYLKVHVRHRWTGLCRACGDPHPCRDHRDARIVLGGMDPAYWPPGKRIAQLALRAALGLLLIVFVTLWLVS